MQFNLLTTLSLLAACVLPATTSPVPAPIPEELSLQKRSDPVQLDNAHTLFVFRGVTGGYGPQITGYVEVGENGYVIYNKTAGYKGIHIGIDPSDGLPPSESKAGKVWKRQTNLRGILVPTREKGYYDFKFKQDPLPRVCWAPSSFDCTVV